MSSELSLSLQVLQPSELEEILDFEQALFAKQIPDEMERTIASWNQRWRRESLEHYLPLGWSFSARREGKLVGYFIAQAFLFLDGQTQTLWVEHLQFTDEATKFALCELAYKMGREKHLQKVYFPNTPAIQMTIQPYKAQAWQPEVLQVKTTKT